MLVYISYMCGMHSRTKKREGKKKKTRAKLNYT